MPDTVRELRAQFEQGWMELARVYGLMLHPKTLKVAKGIAWNTYLRGRTDEMARRLISASQASAQVNRLSRRPHAPSE